MTIETINYTLVADRLRIGELRMKAIEYTAGVALSVNAIPIALAALFKLSELPEGTFFWIYVVVGWLASGSSIAAAVIFIPTVPKHIECYERRSWLKVTYPACAIGLMIAALAFILSIYEVITQEIPVQ